MTQDQSTSTPSWLSARSWLIVVAVAFGMAVWNHSARISHVSYVSNLAEGDQIKIDADSPTGYESEFRKLVVPERNANSFQWIMQVQEMFENDTLRLKHVDYDNAPDGRSVRTASLYRWWLGTIAWVDHTISGNPIGISVERAALLADPITQLLLLLLSALFIARYFNGWSAALFSVGFVAVFPLGSAFVPGQPGDSTLLLACTIWSVLPLVAGVSKSLHAKKEVAQKSIRRLFFIGGTAGGIGMWMGVSGSLPILMGIAIAGAIAGFVFSRIDSSENGSTSIPLPWRLWSSAGAVIIILAWLIDRSPALFDSTSWQSDFVHPLFALAWLGCGEILAFLEVGKKPSSRLRIAALSLAGISILGLAYTIIFHGIVEAWSIDPVETRLTRLPSDPNASSLGNWFEQHGGSGSLIATLLPAVLLIAGISSLVQLKKFANETKMIAIALGPTLFAFGHAIAQLGWWSLLDGLALVLAIVAISFKQSSQALKWTCTGVVLFASMMGIGLVYSNLDAQSRNSVETAELETLLERHLAQWISRRAETDTDATLAPPNVSVSLAYFASLKVLGTPYPENNEGFAVAVRLCAASTPDEARALATGREVNLIVHPSWDTFLEDYARLGSEQPENSFIALLNRWLPPRWLEPVSFQLPTVPGFEKEWVTIYRTVEVQDNTSAIGRLVEYFIYSGRGQLAAQAQAALANNFPDDLVTHITAAQLAISLGDRNAFTRSADTIVESIASGGDFYLTWEFRVSMSLVLAGAKRNKEAKEQLERCLAEADVNAIRKLSEGSLSGILHLAKAWKMDFQDPELKAYAISLLTTEYKKGL